MTGNPAVPWIGHDLRRRPIRLLALALFVCLGAGAVASAVDGARRSSSAPDRAERAVRPAHAIAVPNEANFDWGPIEELAIVDDLAEFAVLYFEVPELGPERGAEVGGFPPGRPGVGERWERPIVMEGRVADQTRADEVTISPEIAEHGVEVGDRLTISLIAWDDVVSNDPDPRGRDVPVTVVGVTKLSFFSWDVQPTHAFYEANADLIDGGGWSRNAVIRLRDGERGVPALERAVSDLAGRPVEVLHMSEGQDSSRRAVGLETAGLAALAAAGWLVVALLVGQALVRMASADAHDFAVLRNLGMTARQAATALAGAPAIAAAVGLTTAPIVSFAVSDRFPIGEALVLEPTPGRQVDWVAIVIALAPLAAMFIGALALAGRRMVATGRPAPVDSGGPVSDAIERLSFPVPVTLGCRLALTGRWSGVSARSVAWVTGTGVAGVVAALTFASGMQDAIDDNSLFGQGFDAGVLFYDGEQPTAAAIESLDARDIVHLRNVTAEVAGQPAPVIGGEVIRGEFAPRARRGVVPTEADEVALSTETMRSLGVDIGDRIDVGGQPAEIVGEALVPEIGHNAYTSGVLVADVTMDRLLDEGAQVKFEVIGFTLRDGATLDDVRAGADPSIVEWIAPVPPVIQQQALTTTRALPRTFAGFVALVALGSVANALAATARQRRQEVAVLQVVGLTRKQARHSVLWHAGIATVVGGLVGAPVGFALGRTLWRVVAHSLPAVHQAPDSWRVALVLAAVAVLVGLLAAGWPARRTASTEPALVLRAE